MQQVSTVMPPATPAIVTVSSGAAVGGWDGAALVVGGAVERLGLVGPTLTALGRCDGCSVGCVVGVAVGLFVGCPVGRVGCAVGCRVG